MEQGITSDYLKGVCIVKFMKTGKWGLLILMVLSLAILPGCKNNSGEAPGKKVKLAYMNWTEGVALTHLMTCVLEDMDYEVDLTLADVALIYAAVSQGDQDIMMETWMPVTHQTYWKKYQGQFEVLGTWFDNARIGLVVPEFVEIDSIEQLNNNNEKFDNEIIGIDSGSGVMEKTERAIEQYQLDYKLVASSGPAMTAALKAAIDRNEPVVVTGWTPHWKFARYDLKFLQDPQGVYGSTEEIRFICRKGFKKDMPKVAALFENISFNAEQINSLMDAVTNAEGDEKEAARDWLVLHKELIDSWKEGIETE